MQPSPTPDARSTRTTLTLTEAAVVIAICFGLFVVSSIDAVAQDFPTTPFADGETLAALVLELVLAAGALLYLKSRGFDLRSLRNISGGGAAMPQAVPRCCPTGSRTGSCRPGRSRSTRW